MLTRGGRALADDLVQAAFEAAAREWEILRCRAEERYYGDLSEAQIASAMGISRGAVKGLTARAIASLRAVLEMET